MALSTGTRLGPYEVLAPLGAGGMGEVYRARDTRLGRDVALKILPEEFASDNQRLARFEREAQLLAALNHPNIAAIHGIERVNGWRFLVLEMVPGETLSARIARGSVPLDEALVICRQIAEALEAAHERGIIHRDLKPANVKITPDGKVKVLDFGLAKIVALEAPPDASDSPTISAAATRAGMILGTAAYMSPEQARGGALDKRTDVWSFGCLMYELLTGQRAFVGSTVSDTLASLLKMEPDWKDLPAGIPPSIERLLRRCLQKQLRERLHDIGDARLEIEEALKPVPLLNEKKAAGESGMWRWTAIALAAAIIALLWWRPWGAQTTTAPITKFALGLPPNETLAGLARPAIAFSPDGSKLAYVASRAGVSQIYLRSMQQAEAAPLPGTEGASGPFFSPDGQWLGFLVSRSLKKVSLLGGPPQEIAKVPPIGCGADWAADGSVILSLAFGNTGLHRLPAAGGEPQVLTTLDSKGGERSHCWPQVLPSGNEVLFTIVTSADPNEWRIALLQLKTGKWETLLEGASMARYSASGHLAYVRGRSLMVAPFDVRQLKLTRPGVPVVENVLAWGNRASQFSISTTGALAYVTGGLTPTERTLVWVTRQGRVQPVLEQRRAYDAPRLSPDGQRLMVQIGEPNEDIWQLELGRGVLTRITTEDTREGFPVWCDGGQRVVFASDRARRPHDLFWQTADGSGATQALLEIADKPYPQFPFDCTANGMLIFAEDHVLTPVAGLPTTGWDIAMVSLAGGGKIIPLAQTRFDEFDAQVSPDGHWLAYVSNESGRWEVYVQAFPGGGQKLQVSAEGGNEPRWSRNGRELFYRMGNKMMAVQISGSPALRASRPQMLFEGSFLSGSSNPGSANYDVAADGRFVMIRSDKEAGPTQINIVLNWFEELKQKHSPK